MVDELYTSTRIGSDDIDIEKSWFSIMQLDKDSFVAMKHAALALHNKLGVINSHELGNLPVIFSDVLRAVNASIGKHKHTSRHMVDTICIAGNKYKYVELRESVPRSAIWDTTVTFPLDALFSVSGTSSDVKTWRFDAWPGLGLVSRCRRSEKRLPLAWDEPYPTPVD